MSEKNQNRFCPHCGHSKQPQARFCPRCGRRADRRGPKAVWVWIGGGALLGVLVTFFVVSGMRDRGRQAVSASHNTALIANIVSAFDCSCGQCEKTLESCDCPTAVQTNEYIAQVVDKGRYSRKEIIQMVNKRYGYLRDTTSLEG